MLEDTRDEESTSRDGRLPNAARPSAIVVGSGFGGAVAACRLAQAQFEVVILERGRRYEAADFPAVPPDAAFLPDVRRWSWKHQRGLWDVIDLKSIVSLQAAGYGGGSLIYANVHLRPPDSVFDSRWPSAYRGGALLRPYFDLAAYMLEVAPANNQPQFLQTIVKAAELRHAAQRLHRDEGFFYPPLAISYARRENRHGVQQRACTQCGRCSTGCPEGAKHTLDYNYLAVAERHGARVVTQCEVIDIEHDGRLWVATCVDHVTARPTRHSAEFLFLCAGTLHSTRLLARARLGAAGRSAQRNVGAGYFPGGGALGAVFDTARRQLPSRGPAIATSLVHFDRQNPSSFFLIQDGGYGPELERLVGVMRAPALLGCNRLTRVDHERRLQIREPDASSSPTPEPQEKDFVLTSVLDELLDASSSAAFSGLVHETVRQAFSAWLDEFEMPLLLSAIVDSTIQRSARAALERSWLAKRFPEAVRRWIAARLRQGAHALFGNGQQIAEQALRSILDAGGLPRREVARRVLGYDDTGASHRAVLLGMGRDAVAGQLHYDRHSDELRAELDLSRLAPGYTRQERLMSDIARELGGELRTNPAWAFVGKPVTVHNQGGCRMSDDPASGVTNANGQVYGCEGLYVLDGSVLPAPVGVNPSATILAIAERNIEVFLRNHPRSAWSDPASEPARAHNILRADASRWVERATGWHFAPPEPAHGSPDFRAQPLGLRFQEWLHGYFSPTDAGDPIPRDDADYRAAEARGRPGHGGSNDAVGFPIDLALTNTIDDLNVYYEDTRHTIRVAGKVAIVLPGRATPSDLGVNGQLCLFVPRPERLQPISAARRRDRFLRYELILASDERGIWLLRGKKRLRADAALEAWLDLSTVLVRLFGPFAEPPDLSARDELQRCCRRRHLAGIGAVHLDMTRFLHQQLPSFEVFPADDPARTSWAISKFAAFFFGELQRIYMPELFTTLGASFRAPPSSIRAGNMR